MGWGGRVWLLYDTHLPALSLKDSPEMFCAFSVTLTYVVSAHVGMELSVMK